MITHVAIWRNNTIYALPKPNRHHHCFQLMPKEERYTDGHWDIQGFIDEENNFLGRKEAFTYATAEGQVSRSSNPQHYQGPELFSEDLW